MLTGVNWLLFLIIIFGSKIDLCLTPNNSWHNEREWQTTARNFFDWLTFSRFKNLVPQNHQLQLGATDDLAYITGSHTASVLPLSGLRELPSVLEFSGKHQPISPMLFCLAERASGYQCGCVWYCITMDTLHGSKENKYRRPWRFKLCAWTTVGKKKKKELPEQLNSCFWISATLIPRSCGGDEHCVNRPSVGLWRSHWDNQDRWQSQFRLFECRRLKEGSPIIMRRLRFYTFIKAFIRAP